MLTKWILSRPALLTFCCLLQACGGGSDASPPVPPPVEFTLSAVAGAGGKISPASLQVGNGQTGSFTVSPDEGYEVATVTGCNGVLNGTQYITAAAVSACTVSAEFKRKSYQIVLSVPPQPAETFNVSHGDRLNIDIRIQDQALTLDKAEGCAGELKPVGDSGRNYAFLIAAVTQSCELKVSTKQRPILINISAGEGGTVYPASQTVRFGDRVIFQIEAERGAIAVNQTEACGQIIDSQYVIEKATVNCNAAVGFLLGNDPVGSGILNDTGAAQCFNDDCRALTDLQDGAHGRDAAAKAGTLIKTGQGDAGFDLTKLNANGQALPYASAGWSCVKDNNTGLIWEIKSAQAGLQHNANSYSWFSNNKRVSGDNPGVANGGVCVGSACDSQSYIAAVNQLKLCGRDDWRLPTLPELLGIVHNGKRQPAIDQNFFPETLATGYWTQSMFASGGKIRIVHFGDGASAPADKSAALAIRLVSTGN